MAHFYLADELLEASVGDRIAITGAEARHAVTVSRIRAGESLLVGNGSGLVASGPVVVAEPTELAIVVEHVTATAPPSPAIWLAQALAKGDRDEFAVQAASELGVDGVIPWAAQRSIVKWEGPKIKKGHERWSAIVREATKQSLRPWLPEVSPVVSSRQLAALAATTRMLVLEPTAELALSDIRSDGRDIVLVVGPEGGIAPGEIAQFAAAGA
ncbi:MAG TPA: 16S rRNA (uracil(1498)-N(3))-methyltransferase, partial [Marisediminicola sp.]|nr:16S rRNA (uracil(1498)-N(3))-methyltransferase [Marisediminicola sp.]